MRLCSRLTGKRKPRPGLGVAAFSPKQPAARRRRWRRAHFGTTGLKACPSPQRNGARKQQTKHPRSPCRESKSAGGTLKHQRELLGGMLMHRTLPTISSFSAMIFAFLLIAIENLYSQPSDAVRPGLFPPCRVKKPCNTPSIAAVFCLAGRENPLSCLHHPVMNTGSENLLIHGKRQ